MEYDGPWKEAIEEMFEAFLFFFKPFWPFTSLLIG